MMERIAKTGIHPFVYDSSPFLPSVVGCGVSSELNVEHFHGVVGATRSRI